jgi:hypothetical protein
MRHVRIGNACGIEREGTFEVLSHQKGLAYAPSSIHGNELGPSGGWALVERVYFAPSSYDGHRYAPKLTQMDCLATDSVK